MEALLMKMVNLLAIEQRKKFNYQVLAFNKMMAEGEFNFEDYFTEDELLVMFTIKQCIPEYHDLLKMIGKKFNMKVSPSDYMPFIEFVLRVIITESRISISQFMDTVESVKNKGFLPVNLETGMLIDQA
jgi:hypothetical protein